MRGNRRIVRETMKRLARLADILDGEYDLKDILGR